jgi:hypothetical protein
MVEISAPILQGYRGTGKLRSGSRSLEVESGPVFYHPSSRPKKFQEAFDMKMLLLGYSREASSRCLVQIASRVAESPLPGTRTQPLFRHPQTPSLSREVAGPTFYILCAGSWLSWLEANKGITQPVAL